MELVADANVLIDYVQTDSSILELHARHLGPIYVPSVILDEVDQLDERACQALGLTVIYEPVEILLLAGQARGPLSFEDRVCLFLARNNGWTCVTNEKALHKHCVMENVQAIWGLRLTIDLVRAAQLTRTTAIQTARAIQAINSRYITEEVMTRFVAELP